ncbi:MAG: CPBP family intramembrane glutamic endopeptidase [Bacillota bacterium]
MRVRENALALVCAGLSITAALYPSGRLLALGGLVALGILVSPSRSGLRSFRLVLAFIALSLGLFTGTWAVASLATIGWQVNTIYSNAILKLVWAVSLFGVLRAAGWQEPAVPLRPGRTGRSELLAGVGLLLLFGLWFHLLYQPPGPSHLAAYFTWPTPALVWIMAVFVVTNGVLEEIIFRHLLLSELLPRLGARAALFWQALLFGAFHYGLASRPHGLWGVLATTLVGLYLGWVARRSRGIGWAAVFHILLDIIIVLGR